MAPCLPVFGQQRAQPRRLFAVEHAALGRTLAAFGDRHHHAVQRVHVLFGRLHAGKDVAQIDQHGLALLRRAEEFDPVEFAHQIVEERLHLMLRCSFGAFRHCERQCVRRRELEPLIAQQQNGLREIERGERRIDRKGDDAVGERDLLVLQAVALAAEQDAAFAPAPDLPTISLAAVAGPITGLA